MYRDVSCVLVCACTAHNAASASSPHLCVVAQFEFLYSPQSAQATPDRLLVWLRDVDLCTSALTIQQPKLQPVESTYVHSINIDKF